MTGLGGWLRRRGSRRYWEREWARDDFAPPWLGRGVAREVAAAAGECWFAPGAPALDIGCGEGEIAAWLAERGFPSLGIDLADAAIDRARALHGERPGRLEFRRLDICAAAPAMNRFAVLVDRGCFHQLEDDDARAYARNVALASTADARLLLLAKAFRDGEAPLRDEEGELLDRDAALARMDRPSPERSRLVARVESLLGGAFRLERSAPTFLDPHEGRLAGARLPGLAFWLARR